MLIWSGNQIRHGKKVSWSLIFAVRNESANTAKIKRLENWELYIMSVPIMWFTSSSILKPVTCQFIDGMAQPTIDMQNNVVSILS